MIQKNKTKKIILKTWAELEKLEGSEMGRKSSKIYLRLSDGIALTQKMELAMVGNADRVIEVEEDSKGVLVWNKTYAISPLMVKAEV